MLGFFKNLLSDNKLDRKTEGFNSDTKTSNPINELQILEHHTDIVRILIKIDECRIASGADDGLIVLWHTITGERSLILKGHNLPITCMMLLERNKLLSGSADKTIRIWDVQTGVCIKILKGHEGSVKCIVPLTPARFCSGANDRLLCIWKNDGELINKLERREEENIQCLLPIGNNRLITGSNSSLLLVYRTDTAKVQILAYHRESVRCLIRINASHFASGSMDGAVVIWQTESLTPIKILNNPENYRSNDRIYIYNVRSLLSLGDKYLAASIGNGFKVFDIDTEECIMDCSNVHDAEVNCLISLYDGYRILSGSADGSIKIWGTAQKLHFRKRKEKDEEKSRLRLRSSKVDAVLLGEMYAHTDSVNQLLGFTENSFASCSSDGSVILWKDGRVESELRNLYALKAMKHQTRAIESDEKFGSPVTKRRNDDTDEEGGSAYYSAQNFFEPHISFPPPAAAEGNLKISISEPTLDTNTPATPAATVASGTSTVTPPKTTRVPDYILDFAERLRKEKKLSIEQISAQLRQMGHSDAIVLAVSQKQQAILSNM